MAHRHGHIVVGVDGSADSLAAAEVAAAIAVRRGVPLHVLHGYQQLGHGVRGVGLYAPATYDPREEAAAMVGQAADALRGGHPDLQLQTRHIAGGGASALVTASRDAGLVVVGRRGLGGFAELLLGSVSTQVAAYAHCPVLIVQPSDAGAPSPPSDAPILVGVDGSSHSISAIEFAFTEAAIRAAPLIAAHVYWAASNGSPPVDTDPEQAALHSAQSLLADTVGPWAQKYPQVSVELRPIRSLNPEASFVEASRDSALVVVGSRGRGGFKGLLLGSVSQALVHHAHCPVAIVRP